jgi:hypothetical protein
MPEYDPLAFYTRIKNEIPKHRLIPKIFSELKSAVTDKNKYTALQILTLMQEEQVLPSKDMLEELLQIMRRNNFLDGQVFDGIIKLIRNTLK